MSRQSLCAYGNCQEWFAPKNGVTVTIQGEQKRYCGLLHALWALIRRARERHLVREVTPIEGTGLVSVDVVTDSEEGGR